MDHGTVAAFVGTVIQACEGALLGEDIMVPPGGQVGHELLEARVRHESGGAGRRDDAKP